MGDCSRARARRGDSLAPANGVSRMAGSAFVDADFRRVAAERQWNESKGRRGRERCEFLGRGGKNLPDFSSNLARAHGIQIGAS
jgi:hypothetical protein